MRKLNTIPTSELIDELKKREAVEVHSVLPYELYTVSVGGNATCTTGPAIVLVVTD